MFCFGECMPRGNKQFSKQLVTLARQSGGSFKTVADRSRIAARLAETVLKLNIQIRDVKHIKIHHIETYISHRLTEGISKRTLQNEMAALRAILATAGRTKLADPKHEKLSNDALKLSGASREGTKTAISDERFHEALTLVRSKDEGVALAMEIARYLGLRTEEAVQSAKSLKTWQKALERGDERLRIVFGTKGGRPRDTTVVRREELVRVVNAAMIFSHKHDGKLVDKSELKSAIDKYRNTIRGAGLTGKIAPHSLRYAYSQDAKEWYIKRGFSLKEAEALVSIDLGHGNGRGHYIARVYNR
jgi:site-specific recombinase XerD